MLDIDKLSAEFDDFLSQFDENDINEWVRFDNERLSDYQQKQGEQTTLI